MSNQHLEYILSKQKTNPSRQIREHEVLRIAAALTEVDKASSVRQEVLKWAQNRTSGRLPQEAWSEDSFQHLSSGRTCMAERVQSEDSDIWALRIDDPDKKVPDRVWSTEVVVGRKQGQQELLSLRLLVTTSEAHLQIEPHVPGVVLQIAKKHGLQLGKYAFRIDPIVIRSEADYSQFIAELVDVERSVPIIALSVAASSDTPEKSAVDAAVLARAVVGLARVFVIPAKFTWELSERFGNRLSVFEGAARVYLPGFSADADPFGGHDLFLPRNLPEITEKDILSRLLRSVARASIRRLALGKSVLSFSMVRNQSLQQRQRDLVRSGASEREQLSTAELRIKFLEEQLGQEQFVSDEFARLHEHMEERAEAAEAQLGSAGFRIQQLIDQIRAKGDAPDANLDLPKEWRGFAEWCDLNLAGRVALAPQARRSIKVAGYAAIEDAARCLLWLANELRDAKINGNEGTLRDVQVLPGILNAHCGADQFDMEWRGEKRTVDWHIKTGGNTRDPLRSLRIYYFWDEASQQSVIASMPAHRRTDAS